jgi:hypothetical protein
MLGFAVPGAENPTRSNRETISKVFNTAASYLRRLTASWR